MLSRIYSFGSRTWLGLVSVVTVVLQATRAIISARTARILLATVMVMGLLLSSVSPTAAYRLSPNKWPSGKKFFIVCIDNNIPSFKQDQIRSFLIGGNNPWGDESQATWGVYEGCGTPPAWDIEVKAGNIGPAATTGLDINSNGNIAHATIYFNEDHLSDFYWGNAVQDCRVGIGDGCEMDARTVSLHEFGHALGIQHNTAPTNEIQRCDPFYDSDAASAACTLTGTAMMHWNAGAEFINNYFQGGAPNQGYRHPYLKPDDKDAIVALFGAP